MRRNLGALLNNLRNLRGIRVGGRHYRLPFGAVPNLQEPWMHDVLARLLPEFPGAFLDVGANLGQTMLQFRALDPDRRYIGFEPNPHCAAFLLDLIELNNLRSTELVPAACALNFGVEKLKFFHSSQFDAAASIVPDFRRGEESDRGILVAALPADACLEALEVGAIGVLKVDVEGFEATVLESFEKWIAISRPCIIVEILPAYSEENRRRLEDTHRIERFTERNDYRIFRIIKNSDGRLERLAPLHEIGVHGDMSLVDYVLCPAEKASVIE